MMPAADSGGRDLVVDCAHHVVVWHVGYLGHRVRHRRHATQLQAAVVGGHLEQGHHMVGVHLCSERGPHARHGAQVVIQRRQFCCVEHLYVAGAEGTEAVLEDGHSTHLHRYLQIGHPIGRGIEGERQRFQSAARQPDTNLFRAVRGV